ncbi:sigma-70 family RNA polymerase sigma factor [Rohdeia mirabilis]|uniref:sigma-70 family RNA polymerase sigma factor n=1 Tax=Rohdeia mirabilis TaxID=2528008 RepID=UPI003AF3D55A
MPPNAFPTSSPQRPHRPSAANHGGPLKSWLRGTRRGCGPVHPAPPRFPRGPRFSRDLPEAVISSERCLETYLQEINEVPLLTPEEEKELGRRIQTGDLEARERMIRANLRLVVSIAKMYSDRGLALQDLIAEGNIGLMKAAEKFDPAAGCRFSTYGSWWIKQSIRRALTNTVPSVRVPGYMSEMVSKWRSVSNELSYKLGRTPNVAEVANELGIPEETWAVLRQTIETSSMGPQVSLDALTQNQDVVEDPRSESPDETIAHADLLTKIGDLMGAIDEREATILRLRYGLEEGSEPKTLKEIGKIVGLTRERVRQIEREVLKRLQRVIDGDEAA